MRSITSITSVTAGLLLIRRLTVQFLRVLQMIDHLADFPIHRGNHTGVDLHTSAGHSLLFGVQKVPFRYFRCHHLVRLDVGRDETLLLQSLQALQTQGVRTSVISTFVRVPVFGRALQWPVRRGEWQVGEEGLAGLLLVTFIEVFK